MIENKHLLAILKQINRFNKHYRPIYERDQTRSTRIIKHWHIAINVLTSAIKVSIPADTFWWTQLYHGRHIFIFPPTMARGRCCHINDVFLFSTYFYCINFGLNTFFSTDYTFCCILFNSYWSKPTHSFRKLLQYFTLKEMNLLLRKA